jgi:hypothetical protein
MGSIDDLIVDRTTSIQSPSDEQIRKWARGKRVFISSTMEDLQEERAATADVIEEMGAEPVLFERFGARSEDSRQAYKAEVRRSDIYLGLLAQSYGVKQPSGYSATHAEYEEAKAHHKEILLFLDDTVPSSEREGHLNRWIKELYQQHVLAKYAGNDDLQRHIRTSLHQLAQKEITPWVKLGSLIFQATRVEKTTTGQQREVAVTTASQNQKVLSRLRKMAGGQSFHQSSVQLIFRTTSQPVEVETLNETVDPLGRDSVTIHCRSKNSSQQTRGGFSSSLRMLGGGIHTGGKKYEQRELIELALNSVIFGEPLPDAVSGFVQSEPIDFEDLHADFGDEPNVLVEIARLLIVEAIHEQDLVDEIHHLASVAPKGEQLRIDLEVVPAGRRGGSQPESLSVSGEVDLTSQ